MRLVVDLNKCQGYAQCVTAGPDVLKLHGRRRSCTTPIRTNHSASRCYGRWRPARYRPSSWNWIRRPIGTPCEQERRQGQEEIPFDKILKKFRADGQIVIVGASLAGLRAAEALQGMGFEGR